MIVIKKNPGTLTANKTNISMNRIFKSLYVKFAEKKFEDKVLHIHFI